MKKILGILLALMLVSTQAFASVGLKEAGVKLGVATDIDFSAGTNVSFDGSTAIITVGSGGTITGATINSSTIGSTSPSSGAFTTLSASGTLMVTGDFTENGVATFTDAVILGNSTGDTNTFTGKITGATPLTFDGETVDVIHTILALDDPTGVSKTVTLPAVTGTVKLTGAAVALTPGAAVTLTVAKGTTLYTDAPTDNEDQTITFSGAGSSGDEVTIIFTTAGAGDEVITFESTLVRSTGTLTLGTDAGKYYVVRFISDGSHWFEVSRTAVQA